MSLFYTLDIVLNAPRKVGELCFFIFGVSVLFIKTSPLTTALKTVFGVKRIELEYPSFIHSLNLNKIFLPFSFSIQTRSYNLSTLRRPPCQNVIVSDHTGYRQIEEETKGRRDSANVFNGKFK